MVADFDDEVILAEIPDGGSAARAGRGQDVLDLSIPRYTADVLQRLPKHMPDDKQQTVNKNKVRIRFSPPTNVTSFRLNTLASSQL